MSNTNPLQLLRSSTANKRPLPAGLVDGRPAINTNSASPGLFFKDSAGALVKVGPVHVGATAPNSSPASGGATGNSVGEQWLDTSGGTYVFKVWDGSAWRSESGTFVDVNGDMMTGALGIIAGSAAAPGLYISGDTNTGLYSPGADQVSLTTGGTERLRIDSTGQIEAVSLGTAAAPVFSFTGDPNTGIYSPGADQVAISTGGSGRLFVDANGNVGVGTASLVNNPGYGGLTMNGADGAILSMMQGGSETLRVTNATGYSFINTTGATPLLLGTAGNERLRITSAGLVGVGTSTPGGILDIRESNSGGTALAQLVNTSNTASSNTRFKIATGGTSAGNPILQFTNDTSNWYINADQSDSFKLKIGTTVSDSKLVVDSSGRVGIGTTSPGARLNVNPGTITASQSVEVLRIDVPGELISSSATGYIGFRGFDVSNNTQRDVAYIGTQLAPDASNTPRFGGHIVFGTCPTGASQTPTERARIDSSGRLLVGTSSARSQAGVTTSLQVEDGAYNGLSLVTNNPGGQTCPVILMGKSNGNVIGSSVAVSNGDRLAALFFQGADGTDIESSAGSIECFVDGTPGANDMPGRLVFSTTADGASSPTERMRIGQNGYIKASNNGSYGVTNIATGTEAYHQIISNAANINLLTSATNSGGTAHASSVTSTVAAGDLYRGYVESSGAIVYRVFSSGNVQNTNNSYGAISDIKLKENIVDATSQWSDIKALQVRKYNLKEGQTHTQIGLIAQEVELVSPGLVSESPDRDEDGNDLGTVTKSVNYSVLYMKAVKALQEAMERIETLEAKVAALESA